MIRYNSAMIFIYLILAILNCSPNDPEDLNSNESYYPLKIGITRQLAFKDDSATILIEVIDTTRRADGKFVYIESFKYGTEQDTVKMYVFYEGNFCVVTHLDTLKDSSGVFDTLNPFYEQKFALIKPTNNFKWYMSDKDSLSGEYVIAKLSNTYPTYIENFKDPYKIDMFESDTSNIPYLSVFYYKNLGWIGSIAHYTNEPSDTLMLTYFNNGTIAKGKLWKEKDPTRESQLFHRRYLY